MLPRTRLCLIFPNHTYPGCTSLPSGEGPWPQIGGLTQGGLTVGASCRENRPRRLWSAAWACPYCPAGGSRWHRAWQPPGWLIGRRRSCIRAGPIHSHREMAPLPGGSRFPWHFEHLPYPWEADERKISKFKSSGSRQAVESTRIQKQSWGRQNPWHGLA